jgi:tetratricopeptide (TPR) repeat protein
MRFVLLLAVLLPAAAAQEDIPALLAQGDAGYMRGDYEAARQSFLKAWELAQQTPPTEPVRYDVLKRLTSVRSAAGEFADADNYLQMAINWRETVNGPDDPKLPEDLLHSAGLCRAMKNYDRALLILNRVMALHRARSGMASGDVADDLSRIAQVQMEQNLLPAAIATTTAVLRMRTDLAGPLDRSLLVDLDRLAGAQIAGQAYDKAEEAYRHALVIRETLYGKDSAELITTVDGLAYACFGQKKYDEAEPIYQRLLELWTKSVGADHPMMALAYEKVAVFYAEQKKYEQSKEAEAHSNAIRAHFLAVGLSGAAMEQVAEGHKADALALYKRVLTVLNPPDPLYDSLRSDTEGIVRSMAPRPRRTAKKSAKP